MAHLPTPSRLRPTTQSDRLLVARLRKQSFRTTAESIALLAAEARELVRSAVAAGSELDFLIYGAKRLARRIAELRREEAARAANVPRPSLAALVAAGPDGLRVLNPSTGKTFVAKFVECFGVTGVRIYTEKQRRPVADPIMTSDKIEAWLSGLAFADAPAAISLV